MEINEDFVSLRDYDSNKKDIFTLLESGIKKLTTIYVLSSGSNLKELSPSDLQKLISAYPDRVKISLGKSFNRRYNNVTEQTGFQLTTNYQTLSGLDCWIKKDEVDRLLGGSAITKASVETEKTTMLKMLLGMAMAVYDYDPTSQKNVATGSNKGSIKYDLGKYGLKIHEETVRKYLKEAYQTHRHDLLEAVNKKSS